MFHLSERGIAMEQHAFVEVRVHGFPRTTRVDLLIRLAATQPRPSILPSTRGPPRFRPRNSSSSGRFRTVRPPTLALSSIRVEGTFSHSNSRRPKVSVCSITMTLSSSSIQPVGRRSAQQAGGLKAQGGASLPTAASAGSGPGVRQLPLQGAQVEHDQGG